MKPQYPTPEQTYNYLENICRRRVTGKMYEIDGGQTAQNAIIKQILERLEALENNVDCEVEDEKPTTRYCDRNICTKNEYNGVSCDECEVAKYHNLEDDDSPCQNCGE